VPLRKQNKTTTTTTTTTTTQLFGKGKTKQNKKTKLEWHPESQARLISKVHLNKRPY